MDLCEAWLQAHIGRHVAIFFPPSIQCVGRIVRFDPDWLEYSTDEGMTGVVRWPGAISIQEVPPPGLAMARPVPPGPVAPHLRR